MDNFKGKLKNSGGFTIMELLVVMFVIGLLSFTGVRNILHAQDKAALDDSKSAVLRSLETAKNRAASGVGTGKHGAYIEEDGITVFEGSDYATGDRDTKYIFNPVTQSDASPAIEVVFDRISGNANQEIEVVLSDSAGEEVTITVTIDGSVTAE